MKGRIDAQVVDFQGCTKLHLDLNSLKQRSCIWQWQQVSDKNLIVTEENYYVLLHN